VPASFDGGDRVRLFCALRLPEPTLDRLVEWQSQLRLPAGSRLVARDNLHITLAFLGHRPVSELEAILAALRDSAAEAAVPVLEPSRYRETQRVGMVVLGEREPRAQALAGALQTRLERLGVYEREQRDWTPHVTVVRFRRRPGLRLDPPDLGPVSPSEVALYHSTLRRDGAQYEVLESVSLGG